MVSGGAASIGARRLASQRLGRRLDVQDEALEHIVEQRDLLVRRIPPRAALMKRSVTRRRGLTRRATVPMRECRLAARRAGFRKLQRISNS